MKKENLKYAMRTAVILAELAHSMKCSINGLIWLAEEEVGSAGFENAKVDGFPVSENFVDVQKAYDNFVSEAITMANKIDELYRKVGENTK